METSQFCCCHLPFLLLCGGAGSRGTRPGLGAAGFREGRGEQAGSLPHSPQPGGAQSRFRLPLPSLAALQPPISNHTAKETNPRPKPSPRVLPVCSILCSPSDSSKFSLLCPRPALNHTWAFPSGLTSPSISKCRKAENLHPVAFASENQRKLFYALRKL